ncbi:MAG: hypothetical protein U0903_09835 [Planctomycetales bacterium]
MMIVPLSGGRLIVIKSFHAWMLMLVGLCLLAGCGRVFSQRWDAIPEWSEEEWHELSDKLAGDQWQPRTDWTFWKMAEIAHEELPSEVGIHWRHPAENIVRDIFEKRSWENQEIATGISSATTKDAPSDQTKTLPVDDAARKSGPATNSTVWSASKRELLHALAVEDSLPGWNGAILIGLVRPQEGAGLLPSSGRWWKRHANTETTPAPNAKTPPPPSKTSLKFQAAAAEACGRILAASGESSRRGRR